MPERLPRDILEDVYARCCRLDASLADRLQAFESELRRLFPHFAVAVDLLVSRLAESNAGASAPKVGDPIQRSCCPTSREGSSTSMICLARGQSP